MSKLSQILRLAALREERDEAQRREALAQQKRERRFTRRFDTLVVPSVTGCNNNHQMDDPLVSTYSHRPLQTNWIRSERK